MSVTCVTAIGFDCQGGKEILTLHGLCLGTVERESEYESDINRSLPPFILLSLSLSFLDPHWKSRSGDPSSPLKKNSEKNDTLPPNRELLSKSQGTFIFLIEQNRPLKSDDVWPNARAEERGGYSEEAMC